MEIEIPDETAPRLSWNRPAFDPEQYPNEETLFRFDVTDNTVKSVQDRELFNQAITMIDEKFTDPEFTIKDIADEFGFCVRQIQRILKENGSPGFRTEIRKRRIALACRKLKDNSEQPLSTIAVQCGYKESSYFSQVFTRDVGVKPSRYRAEVLGQPVDAQTAVS